MGFLLLYTVRRDWRGLLGWIVGFGLTCAVVVWSFPIFKDSIASLTGSLSPTTRALFGLSGSGATLQSWLAINVLNSVGPLVIAGYGAWLGASAVAGPQEHQMLDLLMANPVSRRTFIWRAFFSLTMEILIIVVGTSVFMALAALTIDTSFSYTDLLAGCLNLLPMSMAFGGLALLLAVLSRASVVSAGISSGILFISYIANAIFSTLPRFHWLSHLTAFFYYGSAIERGIDWSGVVILSIVSLGCVAMGDIIFQRRDIYT
jgi:ABC-2 type transport system permease protein